MGIALLCLILVSVDVGCQAQMTKGRTGATWAVTTFVLLFYLLVIVWPDQSTLTGMDPDEGKTMLSVIDKVSQGGLAAFKAIAIGGPIMAIIVATLPKKII